MFVLVRAVLLINMGIYQLQESGISQRMIELMIMS